jgi:hypothetical protein
MSNHPLNIKRDCAHGGRHKHGTAVAYRADRCRCPECRDGDRLATKRRELANLRGATPMVPAARALAHIERLQAAGMGRARIAQAAGVAHCTVERLFTPHQGTPPRTTIRRDTETRILAVGLDINPARIVDGTGTRRRIQALVACGWTLRAIGERLGYTGTRAPQVRVHQMLTSDVWKRTADRVAAVYDTMWLEQPPRGPSAARARALAARRGWVGPLSWDDIDNPDASPLVDAPDSGELDEIAVERFMAGTLRDRVGVHASPERAEAVRRLAAYGMTDHEIGQRVGMTATNVSQFRNRRGIPSGASRNGEAA